MTLRQLVSRLRLDLAREILAANGGAVAAHRLDAAVTDALLALVAECAGVPWAALPGGAPPPPKPGAQPAPGAEGGLCIPRGGVLAALRARWQRRGLPRGLAARLGALYEQVVLAQPLEVADGQVRARSSDRRRRPTGVYYTPRALVQYILHCIPEPPAAVLDPAAGGGAFLLAARARWPAAAVRGIDLDPRAAAISRLALALAGSGGSGGSGGSSRGRTSELHEVAQGDALAQPPGPPDCDLVVGNPPYYSCQSLPVAEQARLRERYPEIWTGQNDILYYFMAEGVRRLRPGGRLAFVVARYFLQSAHARRLREWLLAHCAVEHVLDLQNLQLFPGADVLAVVLVLRREPDPAARAAQRVRVVTVRAWQGAPDRLLRRLARTGAPGLEPGGVEPVPEQVEISHLPQARLDGGPWELMPPAARAVTAQMAVGTVPLGQLCRIGQGMKSGANSVFVVSRELARERGLESELLRPYVKTRDIHPFRCQWRGLYLLDVRNETPLSRYPNAHAYLAGHRAALERRFQFRAGVCRWYALSIPQNAALFDGAACKLITPAYARFSRFAIDDGERYYTLTDTYILVPHAEVSPEFLAGLLNSGPGQFFHRQVAKLKRDGYREYVTGPLSRFPVPVAPPARLHDGVVAAVRALRAAAPGGEEARAELDRLVGELYGLTPAMLRLVEQGA